MSTKHLSELVRNADESELRQRLADLDAERKAIAVLLRSVIARNRVHTARQKAREGCRG